jgi:hypothetical protein
MLDARVKRTRRKTRNRVDGMNRQVLLAGLTALLALTPASADPIEDFYRGKQIKIYVRAAPGGNYDVYSRVLGRHITRHIPGNPSVLPINMPGGGGISARNYVTHVAPRDGTVLTMITQSFPMDQALGLNDAALTRPCRSTVVMMTRQELGAKMLSHHSGRTSVFGMLMTPH